VDVFEAVKGRRSIRRYTGGDVEEGNLKRIMDAGLMAPSAGNIQPWELILVRGEERKSQLAGDALNHSGLRRLE
jgi:nitroreductase